MAKAEIDINAILDKAKQYGAEQNLFYTTTLNRYREQLKIIAKLEKELASQDILVTKEYIKGRGNLYVHPLVKSYNQACSEANKTVSTLLKIITTMRKPEVADVTDPFDSFGWDNCGDCDDDEGS